ncbi:MAG: NAD-dependent epimerase/dehydratase family protein [Nostoc sp. ChiQUE01a]|nr:NAD-dependent epimerase/dehydratase family protein [Nostoc sp. ChiQUE01a]
MKKLLVTGSSGLIGSEVCLYFAHQGWAIHGIDNNQRAIFFGPQGDTRWNQKRLASELKGFVHHEIDIRDRTAILDLIDSLRCYYSDLQKIKKHYPNWSITKPLKLIFSEMVAAWSDKFMLNQR